MDVIPTREFSGPGRADLSNWQTIPYSRWAFHHLREIVPSATISAGNERTFDLPTNEVSIDQFRLSIGGEATLNLEQFLRTTETDGLVILLDGQIVFERYDHGMTVHTPHTLMSGTKTVVGLIAGILHGKGLLDPNDQIAKFVPEINNTPYGGATIRHLLDMRTGVVLSEKELIRYEFASNTRPFPQGEMTFGLHTFVAEIEGFASKAHGGPFSYVSANADLLGWVIERATHQNFTALMSELLWKPMRAVDDAYITLDPEGSPRTTGGLCATTRDFARVGQLMIQGGSLDGCEVVPASWIEDISKRGDREAWQKGEFAGFGMDMSYRSGWYVIHDEPQMMFAMGNYGQNLFVDSSNRLVIAKLSSQANARDYQAMALTHRAVGEIRRCLIG
jgi:CubicO group peptidase (beta-lactamase class C family)